MVCNFYHRWYRRCCDNFLARKEVSQLPILRKRSSQFLNITSISIVTINKKESPVASLQGAGDRTRLPFPLSGNVWSEIRQAGFQRQSTGLSHLDGFESCRPHQKREAVRPPFFWCGRQDSNLHAHAEEPKSTESTNSTTPACGPILTRRKTVVNRN